MEEEETFTAPDSALKKGRLAERKHVYYLVDRWYNNERDPYSVAWMN